MDLKFIKNKEYTKNDFSDSLISLIKETELTDILSKILKSVIFDKLMDNHEQAMDLLGATKFDDSII